MSCSLGGIVPTVDLRGLWTNVRDQGGRESCLACAASDLHTNAHGLRHALSAEYLFYHGAQRLPRKDFSRGLTFEVIDAALRDDGQPSECAWPYQVKHPSPWAPPVVTQLWFGGLGSMGTDTSSIFDALNAGMPVILGVHLVPGFNRVQSSPHIVDPRGRPAGVHAVLAVGTGRRPAGPDDDLLIIRNSWGSNWGHDGHAWLPREYLVDKLIGCRSLFALGNR
jgi:hypothetical protein